MSDLQIAEHVFVSTAIYAASYYTLTKHLAMPPWKAALASASGPMGLGLLKETFIDTEFRLTDLLADIPGIFLGQIMVSARLYRGQIIDDVFNLYHRVRAGSEDKIRNIEDYI